MKSSLLKSVVSVVAGVTLGGPMIWATPLSVTQGRASQRAGTKLVDVYYDLSGGVPPYVVSLQGSLDGGATWTLPVMSVSGDVGNTNGSGSNREITWNAGADWGGQVGANVRFRVNVTDSTISLAQMLAYYPLDGNANDSSGNRHDGIAYNVTNSEDRLGSPRGALGFDGICSYVSLGAGINPTQFSITAWIWRNESTAGPAVIISKIQNLSSGFFKNFELRIEPDGRLFAHVPNGSSWPYFASQRILSASTWYQVAITYDGAIATLYIDGTPESSRLFGGYVQSDVEVTIGARPEGGMPAGKGMFFSGRIDDVRIFGRSLSEAEIQDLYNVEK